MTPEQKQQWDKSGLKEACQRALKLGRTHQETDIQLFLDMLLEIERLEPLVKSQEADLAEMQERIDLDRSIKNTMARHAGDAGARAIQLERQLTDAASAMRSRCVEKVKSIRDEWSADKISRDCGTPINALNEAITALESVSIHDQEFVTRCVCGILSRTGLCEHLQEQEK